MLKKSTDHNTSALRIRFLSYVMIFVSFFFIARLFQIQVLQHDNYRALAQEQYWNIQEIEAKRGDILSSDGYPLATTQVSYLLYLEPKLIDNEKKSQISYELSEVLAEFNKFDLDDPFEFHKKQLDELLSKDLYWVKVISDLSPEEKERIEELNFDGLGFEEDPLRYYPEGSLASHVLGFVARDELGNSKGYFGIEGSFNGDLGGRPGRIVEEQDAVGSPILLGGHTRVDPINGRNVVLSIDRGVQYLVEKILEDGVKNYDAVSGSVIVMDPYTGDIVALANYPTYDPENFNDYGRDDINQNKRKDVERRNLAIAQTYEPGSVMKPITVASGIDLGVISRHSTFLDNGPVQYSDYVIDNWNGQHHGVQDISQLLQKSNNIGSAWVGHLVGSKDLSTYLSKFGFGTLTGVNLEGEDTGIIRPYNEWTDIDLATVAFGQGISATPLQVINSFNALANGGVLMKPRIVKAVFDGKEKITMSPQPIRRVISEESSKTMVELLTEAVAGGESKYFNIKNYHIAGKTGTAQIPINGKYDPEKTNATFVGFLTTSKKFSMIVKLEEPESSIYAAETAVPLWMDIADELVKYYGIPIDFETDTNSNVLSIPSVSNDSGDSDGARGSKDLGDDESGEQEYSDGSDEIEETEESNNSSNAE